MEGRWRIEGKAKLFQSILSYSEENIQALQNSFPGFFTLRPLNGKMLGRSIIGSITEYFRKKYPEYVPVVPSEMHRILEQTYHQRMCPSNG